MNKIIFVALLTLTCCSFLETMRNTHLLKKEKGLNNLTSHGTGVTDLQESIALGLVSAAVNIYADDLYNVSVFIQTGLEKAYSGNWNVEIFTGDPSWGRATHIKDDKWILFFAYGDYEMDIIIWVSE